MNNQENRPFLNIKEVSELLGISVSTVNRLIKKGDFPPKIKLTPGRMVFMRDQIYKWIENRQKNTYKESNDKIKKYRQ